MNIKLHKVERSSTVAALGYSRVNKTLRVRFHTGKVYTYRNVSRYAYDKVRRAPSVGACLYQTITSKPNKHPYTLEVI